MVIKYNIVTGRYVANVKTNSIGSYFLLCEISCFHAELELQASRIGFSSFLHLPTFSHKFPIIDDQTQTINQNLKLTLTLVQPERDPCYEITKNRMRNFQFDLIFIKYPVFMLSVLLY